MSAHERTGWRDEDISRRHREWGYNCPAVDLDFVMAEYNYGRPVALVEYKYKEAQVKYSHPTYKALRALADGYGANGIPFIIAFYCNVDWWFQVVPMNKNAENFYQGFFDLTESQFVDSLYHMRKNVLLQSDVDAINRLNKIPPP